ncbi:MAG: ATP-binding protein [Acidimicrobiales bacterium]
MKRAIKDPIAVAIIIAGVVLTIGLAVTIRNENRQAATLWLDERAELIEQATKNTVDRTFSDLKAVAAFLASSETMTQERFARFVEQMDMNPGVIGIGYVSIVEDTEIADWLAEAREDVPTLQLLSFDGLGGIAPDNTSRPVYYPLRYVYGGPFLDVVIAETPIESQLDALGFDLATEPLWLPAFEGALTQTTPSVSDLLAVGGVFQEQAFGVAHPVVNELDEIEGVLVAPGLEILLTADLGIAITSKVMWQIDNEVPEDEDSDWPDWQRELDLDGSTWRLTVAPTDEALSDLTPKTHWLVVAIGLGLTALLATTALQLRLRRRERAEMNQLQQVAADKDRFLATVSHELRTPLTVVVGLSHELSDRGASFGETERNDLLEMIGEHSEEAASIVEDLLVAARSDIDKLAIHSETVNLAEEVEIALSSSPLESAQMIGEPGTAFADPQRVRQILRNLMTNASRYGGPNVEIRFSESATNATVTVADDGHPISDTHRKQIFDPYTSAHENGDHLGSIGLGLFISLKLARLMGGDLHYHHDGTHSLFSLHLPRSSANRV